MKHDKYFDRKKRIIWLKKKDDELYKLVGRAAEIYGNLHYEELPSPIHNGYWGDFVPHSRFFGSEREKVINEVLDACFKSRWSRVKNFIIKKRRIYYRDYYTDNIFSNISKEKYNSLSAQAKKFFTKDTWISTWNRQLFTRYRPLTHNIVQQCEWKFTKSYITHTAVPNTEAQKEISEVLKELRLLTDNNPWDNTYNKWSNPEYVKKRGRDRRSIRDKIKIALNTQDWDVLD